MKKIIRLTESDLHNLVQRSVVRVLQEQDNALLLQTIAQAIVQQGSLSATMGEQDADFELQNGNFANVAFEVDGNPYMHSGMRSSSYDVPNDDDEVIDNPTVEVLSIDFCNGEGECLPIHDNGIVKKALEKVIDVDYDGFDIPSEEDYFFDDNPYNE